jgi:hypothetical protein
MLLLSQALQAQLYINEFMASNGSTTTDEFGENDDWVEIYNAGNLAVNLAGMYVTDDLGNSAKWQIPSTDASKTTISPKGYLVLWFDGQPSQGVLHVNPKLSASGESIGLYRSDGSLVDTLSFGVQTADVSVGRIPDGGATFRSLSLPTPGKANVYLPPGGTVSAPEAVPGAGYFAGPVRIAISSATPGANIYYTFDGSEPTQNSLRYTAPFLVSKTTALRARAFASGMTASTVSTDTYLIGTTHSLPVVSISVDPIAMFDTAVGLYPNYTEEIEIPAHIELLEPNGTLGLSQLVEIEIQGTTSAELPMKSLAIKAKASLGDEVFDYKIFPDLDWEPYRSFMVRNSGQDWNYTMFRDALASSLAADLSDVAGLIDQPRLHTQGYRPGVVYINGAYWGLHNIRERSDNGYLKTHFDLDETEVDFLDELDEIREGDLNEWNKLQSFLLSRDFSQQANYDALTGMVDVEEYMDYVLFNLFIDNQDWPGNNNRRFREKSPDGKWRWMVKDLDFSFGLFTSTGWNTSTFTDNSLQRLLHPHPYNWPNPEWSTRLFNSLRENPGWRQRFINRMADQLNVLYQPARISRRIDQFLAYYAPEVARNNDRWHNLLNQKANAEKMRTFGNGRAGAVRQHFVDAFAEATGIAEVTLAVSPAGSGEIRFSSIRPDSSQFPWRGTYFTGNEIPATAIPARGFVFDRWSGASTAASASTNIRLSANASLTANFKRGSTLTTSIVINEINYNSPDFPNSGDWVELHNPNTTAVDISGWYLSDESNAYFNLPVGTVLAPGAFLLLVENGADFRAVYTGVGNLLGDFGDNSIFESFKLSNGGERIQLRNANGALIDEVRYDDATPWPVEADGKGPTLQLVAPDLDNALGTNWIAIPATPGRANGSTSSPLAQSINFPGVPDKLTTSPAFAVPVSATSGLTVSLSILAGPATIAGNTITLNGQPGVVFVKATQPGDARYLPATDVVRSFAVTDPGTTGLNYCNAQGTEPWQEWIKQVKIADLDHSSAKEGYADFTAYEATAALGLPMPIALTTGFSWQTFDEHWSVWIDYNQNGNFDDPGEQVFTKYQPAPATGTLSVTQSATVLIPASAKTGKTRLRIAMRRGSTPPSACGDFPYGEVEDYTLNIRPAAGSSIMLTCTGNVVLTAAPGVSSIPVSWSLPVASTTCPAGGLSVVQIAGPPNGGSFNTGTTTTIQYEARDVCGNVAGCSFTVQVVPFTATLTLNCPSDLTLAAPSPAGTSVNYPTPTASSDCPTGSVRVTRISGPASGSLFPVSNTTVTFEATDGCDNRRTCAFTVMVTYTPPAYCESKGDYPWHDWIASVKVGTFQYSSAKSQYSNFTAQKIQVQAGVQQALELTTGFSWETFAEYWRVWIDYNRDGDFMDAGELCFSGIGAKPANGTPTHRLNGNFTVPANATTGETRMRIAMKRGGFAMPCEKFSFGEVEDYTVQILASPITNRGSDELLTFGVARQAGELWGNWVTNTEFKNAYFVVEHSPDSQWFEPVLRMDSRHDDLNARYYEAVLPSPGEGMQFYRLREVFDDGSYRISEVRSILIPAGRGDFTVFPNPTTGHIVIELAAFAGKEARIQLADSYGRVLAGRSWEQLDTDRLEWDLGAEPAGVYLLSLKVEGLRLLTRRVVLVR